MRDLSSLTGIQPALPVLGVWSLNRWTDREFPETKILYPLKFTKLYSVIEWERI